MSSDLFNIPIVLNNEEAGKLHQEEISISRMEKVGEITKFLDQKYPGSHYCLNNAMTQLQEDDIIEDVYEEEDVLTAVQKKQDAERKQKWVENKSGDIVILMDKNNRAIHLEPRKEQLWEFSELDFYPTMAVFRKEYEEVDNEKVEKKIEGERVYKGQRYKIPRDKEVHKFKIDHDGVYKITEGGTTESLPKEDEEVTHLESVFFRPVRSKLQITFENLDANRIHVIDGGRMFYEPMEILGGEMKMIGVKADYRGHHSFGVATSNLLYNEEREFNATMFEISSGGNNIKISKTGTGFIATLIKADGMETPLIETPINLFRESDRLRKQGLLNWMATGVSALFEGSINQVSQGAQTFMEKYLYNQQ